MRLSEMLESLGQIAPAMIGVPSTWVQAPGKYQLGSRVTKGGYVWECRTTSNSGFAGCNHASGPSDDSPSWAFIAFVPPNGLPLPETKWTPGPGHAYGPSIRVQHQNDVFECIDGAKCLAGEMPGYGSTAWKQLTAGSMYVVAPVAIPAPVPAVTLAPVPVAEPPKSIPVVPPAPAAVPEVIMAPVASTTTLAPASVPLAPAVATSAAAAAATAATAASYPAAPPAAILPPSTSKVPLYQRPEVFAGALALIGAGWWYYSKRR